MKKKYQYNEITTLQYVTIIHGAQVGVGQLSLPGELAQSGGSDSWISLIIGWLISVTASLFIIQVMKKYPEGTLIDLIGHLFGKWGGRIFAFVICVFYVVASGSDIIAAGLMIEGWILQQTPLALLILLFAIPTYLITRNGFRILGRYAQLVFFLQIPIVFFLFIPLRDSHFLHLLPVLKEGWGPVVGSIKVTIFSFLGFDLAFFLYPFLQKKESATVGIIAANTLSLIVFLMITLTCFVFFSPDEITQYNQPTLNLLKIIEFKFVERLEIVFLSAYLFIISTTWIPQMFCAVFSSSWLAGNQDHRTHLAILLGVIVGVSYFLDPTMAQNESWLKVVSFTGLCYAYALPVVLWIYLQIQSKLRKGGSSCDGT